jgi:hypothetical protein
MTFPSIIRGLLLAIIVTAAAQTQAQPAVLKFDSYKHYVDHFNGMEDEFVTNLVSNAQSWDWMVQNVTAFECPDKELEEIYWYRWWVYRKALKQVDGQVAMTEFIKRNPVSSAVGHQVMESRWVRDNKYGDAILLYWLRGKGVPNDRLNYSGWTIWAAYQRYLVTGDKESLVGMLDDFIRYYQGWEESRMNPDGSFWQFDVRDAMEESISGSRTNRNLRPPLNSYMYGNAMALVEIGKLAERPDVVETYSRKAAGLKKFVQERLWDPQAQFFKVRFVNGGPSNDTLSDAREAIGFIPWYFELPDKGKGYEQAWAQLVDPQGFWAPYGITTAEQRHPLFRVGKTGTCEWNGPVWPFATSQTLTALGNVMNHYEQSYVTKQHYLQAIQTYAKSMHRDGKPYIGEYLDEQTGKYLRTDLERGRYYNHSTFCDLVINNLVGLRPRADQMIEINPLVPADAWDYFCLDGVKYHNRTLTILWDRTGKRYNQGQGMVVLADGQKIAHSSELKRIVASLDTSNDPVK